MTRTDHDRELFDRIADSYARKDIETASSHAREYQLRMAVEPALADGSRIGTLVEIGCGVAGPARYLAGSYDRYVGIDHSRELVAAARNLHRDNAAAVFHCADVLDVDWLRHEADLVLAVGALHHMPHLDRVLTTLAGFAKSGGWLILVEPLRSNPLIGMLRFLRRRLDSGYSREQVFFRRGELARLVGNAGFEEIEVVYQGYLSTPFAQVVLPLKPISRLGAGVAVAVDRFIDRRLGSLLGPLAWNQIVRARVRHERSP